jgi:hypothetical protein
MKLILPQAIDINLLDPRSPMGSRTPLPAVLSKKTSVDIAPVALPVLLDEVATVAPEPKVSIFDGIELLEPEQSTEASKENAMHTVVAKPYGQIHVDSVVFSKRTAYANSPPRKALNQLTNAKINHVSSPSKLTISARPNNTSISSPMRPSLRV